MKINNQYSSYRDAYKNQMKSEAPIKEKVIVKKDTVEVDLSNASKRILNNEQQEELEQSKKIANIKKAINEGTYIVSSKELADRMFEQIEG